VSESWCHTQHQKQLVPYAAVTLGQQQQQQHKKQLVPHTAQETAGAIHSNHIGPAAAAAAAQETALLQPSFLLLSQHVTWSTCNNVHSNMVYIMLLCAGGSR
jgi:hypothetical protein